MKRHLGMLVAIAAVAAAILGAPTGASAHYCDAPVYVFNYVAGQEIQTATGRGGADLAIAGLVCIVDNQDQIVDPRIVKPGADQISVRYLEDNCPAGLATATVDGLGLSNVVLPLTRTALTGGGATCDSDTANIDPTAMGTLTVTINAPDLIEPIVTCYHTLTASCPDFPAVP